MELKHLISESLNRQYHYRVKFAHDCGSEHMDKLERCLQKYHMESATAWRRTPIEENPVDFHRIKGVSIVSEVCTTDVTLRYPVNERILEVWLATNMGLTHDRVIVQGIKEPRAQQSAQAEQRLQADRDRSVSADDSVLLQAESQEHAHYTQELEAALVEDQDLALFGEAYNEKFLAELKRIRDEKGADYFRSYPSKGDIMGDTLRATWDTLHNATNMGTGQENKEADVISQSARRT